MWLKNLQIYRLPAPWMYTAEQLAAAIAPQAFVAAASTELSRSGWYSPRENDQLVHSVNRQWLLRLRTEKKLLPASVVNQVAKTRADELEEQQGFPPGKKAMKELKERAFDELLPRAFSQVADTWAWIDPVNGWLVVDAASSSRADDLLKLLLKAVDRMPVESLRVQRSPVAVMTGWLESDEAPHGFTIDHDAELRATGESRAAVRFVKHALEVDDVRRHIAAGKQATRLAMTWESRISFVLTETLTIKSVKALDVLMEGQAGVRDDDRFDNDLVLMTAELAKLLADVVEALGGEAGDLVSERRTPRAVDVGDAPALRARLQAEKAGSAPLVEAQGEDDGLYDQAVTVVRKNQRASISLVQRHLRIGYNRAARLLEQMESKHVVSAMQSNGNREVLPA